MSTGMGSPVVIFREGFSILRTPIITRPPAPVLMSTLPWPGRVNDDVGLHRQLVPTQ
jgi:hypothetical protein